MEHLSLDDFVSEMSLVITRGFKFLQQTGYLDSLEVYEIVEADADDPNTEYRIKAMNKIAYDIYTVAETLES